MRRETIYREHKTKKLFCYASGSGALSFTWAENVYPYRATSDPVRLAHVRRYLALRANAGKLNSDHWIYQYRHGCIELVPAVTRVDNDHLMYKGTKYRYEVTGETVHYNAVKYFVTLLFGFDESTREEMETKHISTRLALTFFLKEESTIYAELFAEMEKENQPHTN